MRRRLRHTSLTFALEEALTAREMSLYEAAKAAAYGEKRSHPDPSSPTYVEELYLDAIDAFRSRRPTRGYDLIERANRRALLRLGRSKRRRPKVGR